MQSLSYDPTVVQLGDSAIGMMKMTTAVVGKTTGPPEQTQQTAGEEKRNFSPAVVGVVVVVDLAVGG